MKAGLKKKGTLIIIVTCAAVVTAGAAVLANSSRLRAVFNPDDFDRFENQYAAGDTYDLVAGDGEDTDLARESDEGRNRSEGDTQALETADNQLAKLEGRDDNSADSLGLAGNYDPESDSTDVNPNAYQVTGGQTSGGAGVSGSGAGGTGGAAGIGGTGSDGSGEQGGGKDPSGTGKQDPDQPEPAPTAIPTAAPTGPPTWEEEQLNPRDPIVTEYGELISLQVSVPAEWTVCLGDEFSDEGVTVTAAFRKNGSVIQRTLAYGGADGYSVSMPTQSTGSKTAIFFYQGMTARAAYRVLSSGLSVYYYGEVNGNLYTFAFPGPVTEDAHALDIISAMGRSLYPTSGSIVNLTDIHSRLIAYLDDEAMRQSFQQDQRYKDALFLEEDVGGYLSTMLTGFQYISGGVLESGGPYLYYPVYDWGNKILKNVVDVIDDVPDGYRIKRTVENEGDPVNYKGDQVLEQYTGSDTELQVPMGVTKVALSGVQGSGQKITSVILPEGVRELDLKAMGECLPDLEAYQVSENGEYQVVGGVLYSKDGTVLLSVPAGKTEIREWSGSLRTLAEGAFANSSIQTLTVPETVSRFEKGCFDNFDAETICLAGGKAPESAAETGYKGKILVKDSAYDRLCKDCIFAFQDKDIVFGVMDENGREIQEKTGIYKYAESSGILVFAADPDVLAGIPSGSYGRYVVPSGVSGIGAGAFAGCDRLSDIEVPETVVRLENNSLLLSESVRTITLHAALTDVEPEIFGAPSGGAGVPDVTVSVPEAALSGYISRWTEVLDPVYGAGTAEKLLKASDDGIFYEGNAKYRKLQEAGGGESYRLLKLYTTETTYFQVKDGTSEIASEAFAGCGSLEIVYLPESVERVESGVFSDCSSLTSVASAAADLNLADSDAFGPSGAGDVKVYEAGDVFSAVELIQGCVYGVAQGARTLLDVPSDHSGRLLLPENTVRLGGEACRDCGQLTEIVFSDDMLTEIGSRCFENCTGLGTVDLNGLTRLEKMGDYVFRGCTGLKKLSLPEQLDNIGKGMCYGCTGLAEFTALGISAVGEEWFYRCQSLNLTEDSVNAAGITSVGDRAFAYCASYEEPVKTVNLKSIGTQAFIGCSSLKSAVLPESLEAMGEECFRDCVALESVEMNGQLTAISRYCFYGCRSLTKVDFGERQKAVLKVIGVQAFAQCSLLESMDLGEMKLLEQMGAETFEGCSFLTIVKMPESLEKVPDRCFAGCGNLSILTLLSSDRITALGDHVFGDAVSPFVHVWVGEDQVQACKEAYTPVLDGTYGEGTTAAILGAIDGKKEIIRGVTYILTGDGKRVLTDVSEELSGEYTVLQDTVKIGDEAFKGCTKLTGIVLPNDSNISLGDRCFQGCTSLKDVILYGDIPEWGEDTFAGCTSISMVYLGSDANDRIARIGTRAFAGCTGLVGNSAVSARAEVSVLGEECFAGCSELTGIPLTAGFQQGLVEIEDGAFEGCTGLTTFLTSSFNGLKKIGARAFRDCDSIKSPSIPLNVESIGEECFAECDSLMYVSFYCGLEEYPKDCFKNCPNLLRTGGTAVAFAGLKRIGEGAYEGCASLEISASWAPGRYANLEEIGENAFKGCSGLTEVELSETVTKIGAGAFDGCSSMETLTLGSAAPPHIGAIGLETLSPALVIRVPDSMETGDSVYKSYLAVLSELLGEEDAWRILDSVSDGAKERNAGNHSEAQELNTEQNPEGAASGEGEAVTGGNGFTSGGSSPITVENETEAGKNAPETGPEAGGSEPMAGENGAETGKDGPEAGRDENI